MVPWPAVAAAPELTRNGGGPGICGLASYPDGSDVAKILEQWS